MAKVAAFKLNEAAEAGAPPDGVHISGVAGLWKPGVAYAAEAFGLSAEQVAEMGLPLIAVNVDEKDVQSEFERPPGHLPSETTEEARLAQAEAASEQAAEQAAGGSESHAEPVKAEEEGGGDG